MSYEDLIHDNLPAQAPTRYRYGDLQNLTKEELFACIFVETVCEQLGIDDAIAVFAIIYGRPDLTTRGKLGGAIKGTSRISRVARAFLDYRIAGIRYPSIIGTNIFELRIRWTSSLGAFVGRSVPIAGWTLTTYDLVTIGVKSITRYNQRVKSEDQIHDATPGTLG